MTMKKLNSYTIKSFVALIRTFQHQISQQVCILTMRG